MTAFYILMTISTIAIVAFLFFWTYFRWQRIAKNNTQEWHSKVFWGSLIIAIALVAITTMYWVFKIR